MYYEKVMRTFVKDPSVAKYNMSELIFEPKSIDLPNATSTPPLVLTSLLSRNQSSVQELADAESRVNVDSTRSPGRTSQN